MSRPPLFTRGFALLVGAHFLQALGFSSMLLLPLYLDHLGASRAEIGLLMALGGLGGLCSRPLVGWALDTWGRRPTVTVGTLTLVAGAWLLFFVRDLGPLIYVDRVLFGIGTGTLFTAYFTWASDIIPLERRTEGIALFGISGLLPLGLNAFVDQVELPAADLRLVFTGLGGVILLSLALALAVPEGRAAAPEEASPEPSESLGQVLRALLARPLRPVWLGTVIFAGQVGVFFSFASVTAANRGVTDSATLWLTYAAGATAVRLLGARLPDRLGPANLVTPALACYLGSFIVLAGATDLEAFLLAGLLAGLGHGYCFPVLVSQVVARAPARWRGSALSLFTAVWQGTEMIAAPALGLVSDARDDASMYGLVVALGLVGLLGWCASEHRLAGGDVRSQDAPA